jgi:gamma-glutamyltranspeptidase/glutathione hydrolase
MVAGLLEAHERHGDLPRAEVLAPAIRLAEQGFAVGALLARTIAEDSAKLNATPAARLFWPDGRPLRAGEWLRQPELAATLRAISERGADGFYRGDAAREVVRVLNAGGNPMTLEDLAAARARWKRPVCGLYRGRVVLSAPPPQSGIQIVETLNLLEPYDLAEMGAPTTSLTTFTLLSAALRASTADRNTYVGDPAAGRVPITALASETFAAERGVEPGQRPERRVAAADADALPDVALEDGCRAFEAFGTEHTAGATAHAVSPDPEESAGGETTHLSVVDADGNAVSLTVTQGSYFGAGAYAAGTFLNSAMFLFSDDPDHPNALGPNRVPRSTTTPTMLLRGGGCRWWSAPRAAAGSRPRWCRASSTRSTSAWTR